MYSLLEPCKFSELWIYLGDQEKSWPVGSNTDIGSKIRAYCRDTTFVLYLVYFFISITIFKKAYYQKSLMKQIYFIIALLATVTIGILHLNSGIAFAQNETSQIEDSSLNY